jgi:toxin ParE1/3/4
MAFEISILADAVEDIDNAFIWYEQQLIGLGNDFFNCIDDSINYISINPYSNAVVKKNIRRHLINKFPYGIYYKINLKLSLVQIIAVIHFKRSKNVLKKRII